MCIDQPVTQKKYGIVSLQFWAFTLKCLPIFYGNGLFELP